MSAERAIAWRHGYHAAVCGRVEPWARGTVVRADGPGQRRIEVEDTTAGARLAPGFAAMGWVVEAAGVPASCRPRRAVAATAPCWASRPSR